MTKHPHDLNAAMAQRRVFVTGGSGFVGRNIIRHYREAGADVRALARSEAAAEIIRHVGGTPVYGSLCETDLVDALTGCDLLIHAAANTSHGYESAEQWQVNVEGTEKLFTAARLAGVTRAVHISTESVLLTGAPLQMASETHPLPQKFAGAYSRSKAAAEQAAFAQANETFCVSVVRPRFVWGKGDTTALPQLVAAVSSGKFAWIDGGNYLTSTTHIDNLCDGISRTAEYGKSGEVYFLTDGEPHIFRDFVSQLLATQGITAPDKRVPRSLVRILAHLGDGLFRLTRGRVTSPLNLQTYATSAVEVTLDISKARRELGYNPQVTLREGMMKLDSI